MQNNPFFWQVDLLLETLPLVMQQSCFGLKGGTAINLFVKNMPRYSVDIDLTYLPIEDRKTSIQNINEALAQIRKFILQSIVGSKVVLHQNSKLIISTQKATIKVEPNLVVRGTVFDCEEMELCQEAQNQFEKYVQIKCLSKNDLYGSKICAALDRQHPRDLFDIKLLLENDGITPKIKDAFLAYLISYPRPINEILNPHLLDQRSIYTSDFKDMTTLPVTYEDLEKARIELITKVQKSLSENDKKFLLSFKSGQPRWQLLKNDQIQNLPAVKWKLQNIQKMDTQKHKIASDRLKRVLKV